MALTRWDPFTTLGRFDREFDDLIRRSWGTATPARAGFVPAVEMCTEDTDIVLRLELPGIDVERDVDIVVDKNRLIIRGERRDEREQRKQAVLMRELRYGSFHREFALPDAFEADQVDATYDQGMLEVRLKGVVQPEPEPRQIQVRRGDRSKTVDAQEAQT